MKKQIRFNVFETNSSMAHSLQIMSKEDYDEFMKYEEDDNWVWNDYYEVWRCKDELTKSELEEYSDSFFDEEADYEIKEFTTKHGDTVVAISMAQEAY